MRKVTLKPLLLAVIPLIIFASWFPQTTNPQTARVQTVVTTNTFAGKVVGGSDGDTISVMRGGRPEKRDLWTDKDSIPSWEWRKIQRGRRKK